MSTNIIKNAHRIYGFRDHIERNLNICSKRHDNCRDCEKIQTCVQLMDKIIELDLKISLEDQKGILASFKEAHIDIDSWF